MTAGQNKTVSPVTGCVVAAFAMLVALLPGCLDELEWNVSDDPGVSGWSHSPGGDGADDDPYASCAGVRLTDGTEDGLVFSPGEILRVAVDYRVELHAQFWHARRERWLDTEPDAARVDDARLGQASTLDTGGFAVAVVDPGRTSLFVTLCGQEHEFFIEAVLPSGWTSASTIDTTEGWHTTSRTPLVEGARFRAAAGELLTLSLHPADAQGEPLLGDDIVDYGDGLLAELARWRDDPSDAPLSMRAAFLQQVDPLVVPRSTRDDAPWAEIGVARLRDVEILDVWVIDRDGHAVFWNGEPIDAVSRDLPLHMCCWSTASIALSARTFDGVPVLGTDFVDLALRRTTIDVPTRREDSIAVRMTSAGSDRGVHMRLVPALDAVAATGAPSLVVISTNNMASLSDYTLRAQFGRQERTLHIRPITMTEEEAAATWAGEWGPW